MSKLMKVDADRHFKTFVQADAELRREIIARRSLVGLAGITISVTSGAYIVAMWATLYVLADIAYVTLLRRAPKPAGPKWLLAAVFSSFAIGLWISAMPIYLAFDNGGAFHAVAACIVVGQALHCLSSHQNFGAAFVTDLTVVSIATIGVTIATVANAPTAIMAPAILAASAAVLVYFIHSVRKIVAERMALRRRVEAEAHNEKLRALGQFTSGVAHDFNNMLTVISGNIDLVKTGQFQDEADELLDEAQSASKSAATLVSQLLAYSRKSKLQPGHVSINALLRDVHQVASRLLPASAQLRSDPLQLDLSVNVDRALLETAILNLVINSRDALDGQMGLITIAAELAPGGESIAITVRDTGPGVAQSQVALVTEPFFTTKAVGEGSGLGLSMVQGFMEQSGGELSLDNLPSGGFEVKLKLPVGPAGLREQQRSADLTPPAVPAKAH